MNVTEFVYLTSDIIRYHLFKETPVYRFITEVSALATRVTWKLFIKLSAGGWLFIKDVAQLGLVFACIALFYLLFSFIRSLQPRYRFCDLDEEGPQKPDEKQRDTSGPQYYCIICEEKPKEQSWTEKLMVRLKSEYTKVEKDCKFALNLDDIQDVYGQLSWSQTQIDFESVNWLNQTLQTFWPSIKTMLDKFIIKSLVKPKPRLHFCEIKNLASDPPKLSFYISSRRKLELLKTSTTNWLTKSKRYIDQSAIAIIILFTRVFLIYFKQFIMDYIRYMISNSASRQKERQCNLNLKKFLAEKSLKKEEDKANRSSIMFAPRTWAGFDLQSGRRKKSSSSRDKRRKKKFRSAEIVPRVFFAKNGLTSMAKLRGKRLKLAAKYRNAQDPFMKKELVIEKVRLGNTLPTVTGIKSIEENSICLLNGVNKVSRHLTPSDNSNMKYVVELNYQTDDKFCIQLNSVPILNRIRLTSLGFRLRLLLNFNHTTSELNRDLKILETPGDILWPAINHAQLALVDVPSLDWNIERSVTKFKTVKEKTLPTQQGQKFWQQLAEKYSKYLDPVNLINHLYFKYLIHWALYLSLKWFQAFDIKIGKHLYLKSLC